MVMVFKKRIYELRKSNNMSQEELAKTINVSRHEVSKWEHGTTMPNLEELKRISKVFTVDIEYLLKNDNEDFSYYPNHIEKKEKMESYKIVSLVFLTVAVLTLIMLVMIGFLQPLSVYLNNKEYNGFMALWFTYLGVRIMTVLCFVIIPVSILLLILPNNYLMKLLQKNKST